jgi:hypothetical protein
MEGCGGAAPQARLSLQRCSSAGVSPSVRIEQAGGLGESQPACDSLIGDGTMQCTWLLLQPGAEVCEKNNKASVAGLFAVYHSIFRPLKFRTAAFSATSCLLIQS